MSQQTITSILQRHGSTEDVAAEAIENGFGGFYIDCADPANEPATWTDIRRRRLARMRDVVTIVHGNPRSALASDIPEVRRGAIEYTMSEVRLAAELGSPVVIHGSTLYANYRPRDAIDHSLRGLIDSVHALEAAAHSLGVQLFYENLPPYRIGPFRMVGASLSDLTAIHAELPHVRFALDVGHANLGRDTLMTWWDEIGRSSGILAVSDNAGKADQHLPPGRGNVPFHDLAERLRRDQWRGEMVFECHQGTALEAWKSFQSISSLPHVVA